MPRITKDDPVAAARFTGQLLDDAEALARAPERGKAVRAQPGVRRIVHWPYLIYYRVEENPAIVRILRFWHGARDPQSLRLDE